MSKLHAILLTACMAAALTQAQANDCRNLKVANRKIKIDSTEVARYGNFLTVQMNLRLDSLHLGTNNQLVYTPVLHTTSGDVKMPEIVINGRRQQIMYRRGKFRNRFSSNATVVQRLNGRAQAVHYQATIPVNGKLQNYDVNLNEDVCGCGNIDEGNHYLLKKSRQPLAGFVRPQAEAVKIRHLDKRAYIDFPVDRTELHPDYRRNPEQLDSIINTINTLKSDKALEVSAINIHGYASPESPYVHNDYLARNRAKTLTAFVQRMVNLPAGIFSVSSTPEDWDGLRQYLKSSTLQHRDEILAISNDEALTADAREWKIKTTYPDEYKYMLTNWYPALRHSDYHITYKVKPFNVDEARQLIHTQPQLLSEAEMFMVAQTYEPGSREFNDVMETAVRMFPNNATANLNAACTRLTAGEADAAYPYLQKAGTSAQAQNAWGMYWQLKGDNQKARQCYTQAAAGGVKEAQTNLENL